MSTNLFGYTSSLLHKMLLVILEKIFQSSLHDFTNSVIK